MLRATPWWQKLLKALGSPDAENPREAAEQGAETLEDMADEAGKVLDREEEIKAGTQRETTARDAAIQKNCKEPTIP